MTRTTKRPARSTTRIAAMSALLVAIAAPVAAEAPGLEETRDYIRTNCGTKINNIENYAIRFDGGRFAFRVTDGTSFHYGGVGVNYQYYGRSFGIRDVRFKENSASGFIVECIAANCISEYDYPDSSHRDFRGLPVAPDAYARPGGSRKRQSMLVNCYQADRVVKAFRNLQQLAGGPVSDPFAD